MWSVFSASTTGRRNLEHGTPGQDACQVCVAEHWLVAMVCDGAGSVPEGGTGSKFVTRALSEALVTRLREAQPTAANPADENFRSLVLEAVAAVRGQLGELAVARGRVLGDFACTLVGCIAGPSGGWIVHIGDGFAIQQAATGQAVLSLPENGEFSDETYFITDADWQDHLRFTPLPPVEPGSVIGLLSDGTAPFAVNRERSGFFRPFLDPVTAFLRSASTAQGDAALRSLLESPRASEISADDKTLMLAFVT